MKKFVTLIVMVAVMAMAEEKAEEAVLATQEKMELVSTASTESTQTVEDKNILEEGVGAVLGGVATVGYIGTAIIVSPLILLDKLTK